MIAFFTHNDQELDHTGSKHVGNIETTRAKLTAVFGEPYEGDGYKTAYEWDIKFLDGTFATIYDWEHRFYKADREMPWHIGGWSGLAIDNVNEALKQHAHPDYVRGWYEHHGLEYHAYKLDSGVNSPVLGWHL